VWARVKYLLIYVSGQVIERDTVFRVRVLLSVLHNGQQGEWSEETDDAPTKHPKCFTVLARGSTASIVEYTYSYACPYVTYFKGE